MLGRHAVCPVILGGSARGAARPTLARMRGYGTSACHDRPVPPALPPWSGSAPRRRRPLRTLRTLRTSRPSAPHAESEALARRTILRGLGLAGLGAAAASLGGCGLRWESDAPDLPLLPRDRHPGAEALRAELARAETARQAASVAGDAVAAAANTEQVQALIARLTAVNDIREGDPALGVVAPTALAAPPTEGPTNDVRRRASVAQWAGLDTDTAAGIVRDGADGQDLLLLTSVQVGRLALGRRLGGRWAALSPGDGIADVSPETAATLLAGARRTAYLLDVCAARASDAQKPAAAGARDAVHRIVLDLGTAATAAREGATPTATLPPPLGYPLQPPTTREDVASTAGRALTDLSDAIVAAIPDTWARGTDGADAPVRAMLALRRRAAECEQWHTAWTSRVRGLPGLR